MRERSHRYSPAKTKSKCIFLGPFFLDRLSPQTSLGYSLRHHPGLVQDSQNFNFELSSSLWKNIAHLSQQLEKIYCFTLEKNGRFHLQCWSLPTDQNTHDTEKR